MALPAPKPLPDWWMPLCRYRFGLTPERPKAPKPAPRWCFVQWDRFARWNAWKDSGAKPPRPTALWTRTPQWAWDLRRELRAAQLPEPDPAPEKARGKPSVLLSPGVFMYSAGNAPGGADEFCRTAAAAGFRWIAMLAHEGQKLPEPHINPPEWLPAIRDHGLVPVAWGGLFTEPELEAQVAAQVAEPFDLYIPNGEQHWKLDDGKCPECFERADRFVAEFRRHSDKRGGISTLIGADIHFRVLFDAGFDVCLPQAYANEWPWLTPKAAVDRAVASVQGDFPGWHPLSVAPTVASYGDYQKPMAQYAPLLTEAGCQKRWSYYSGEFLRSGDFASVKALVG